MSGDDSNVPQPLSRALDVFGLGETAKQLVGPLTRGVGKLWAPRQLRRENTAQIDNFNAWDEALRLKGYSPGAVDLKLGERAEIRLLAESIQHQANREAVATYAIEQTTLDIETPLDPTLAEPTADWLDRFWRLAERSTDESVQQFWGMVLSRCATKKGVASARALEFLSLLSSEEAVALERIAKFVLRLEVGDGKFDTGLLSALYAADAVGQARVGGGQLQQLMEPVHREIFGPLGIYKEDNYFTHSFQQRPVSGKVAFELADKLITVTVGKRDFANGVFLIGTGTGISPLGAEIFSILRATADDEFINAIKKAYAGFGLPIAVTDRATNR